MRCVHKQFMVNLPLFLVICSSPMFAAQEEITRDGMLDLLRSRDAAIIELQNTVRALTTRLEVAERAIDPDSPIQKPLPQPIAAVSATEQEQPRVATLTLDAQAAERALERTLTQGGALLLPAWRVELGLSGATTLHHFDFPTIVPDGGTTLLGSSEVETTVFTTTLDVRVGLPFDSQVEFSRPYQWVDQEVSTRVLGSPFGQGSRERGSGIGSLAVGIAKTLLREGGSRPDVVGRLTWNNGSGQRQDEAVPSDGPESIGGSLTLIKRSDPLVFLGSGGYRTVSKVDGFKPGDQYDLSLGAVLAVTPTTSLSASIGNRYIAETAFRSQRLDGSALTSVTLGLGASTVVSRSVLVNVSTGIGISEDAPDYSIGFSTSIQTSALQSLFRQR